MADLAEVSGAHGLPPRAVSPPAIARTVQVSATAKLLERVTAVAERWAATPLTDEAPLAALTALREAGLMLAPFPAALGGCGLGVAPGTQLTLLRVLAVLGGVDLALGRIVEGHLNGVLLVLRYGSSAQIARLAHDVRAGMLSGVWNTGAREVLRLEPSDAGLVLRGVKTFCTGAAFVERPVVTAEQPGRGWMMTVPRMETLALNVDRSFWQPLGMQSSESFGIDFSGAVLAADDVIGQPGDFYRDPMFRGGAIRFASVQAGAVLALHTLFAQFLDANRRGENPYQLTRLGEVGIAAQECALWVERAAAIAEECFYRSDRHAVARMTGTADQMRTAIERLATATLQRVTAGVGAHGLLQPHRFARILRDLTMYLRQPAPDETLAAVGRRTLEALRVPSAGLGLWTEERAGRSLAPEYFERIYQERDDPWGFATSDYERSKYAATLASLPRDRYTNALEVGCSIGVLSAQLAERADRMLCLDVSERALAAAAQRCVACEHVAFVRARVPDEMPSDLFDLIVISEVAYYWRQADLERAMGLMASRHLPGADLVLVHLTEHVPDYPLTGDQVHDLWTARPEWAVVHHERHPRFRLDVLRRRDA